MRRRIGNEIKINRQAKVQRIYSMIWPQKCFNLLMLSCGCSTESTSHSTVDDRGDSCSIVLHFDRCLWRGRSAFCILGLICSPCSANDARRIYVREQSTLVFIYQMVTFHMPYERKESAFQLHCVDIRPIHTLADEWFSQCDAWGVYYERRCRVSCFHIGRGGLWLVWYHTLSTSLEIPYRIRRWIVD